MKEYNYQEYIEFKMKMIKNQIDNILIDYSLEEKKQILEEVFSKYQNAIFIELQSLYRQNNLFPENYELEKFSSKVLDSNLRLQISDKITTLQYLRNVVLEYDDVYENEDIYYIDDVINNIKDNNIKDNIKNIIKKYQEKYGENVKYLGNGGSCIAFSIGDKVIKFGSKRRISKIPYCLDLDEVVQYDEDLFMYVEDKLDINNIKEEDANKLYFELRNLGYVWTDVKTDNLGIIAGEIKIIDDIDIYMEKDILNSGYTSVLKFLAKANFNVALLEINWLNNHFWDFNLDMLDNFFANESNETKELITALKDAYIQKNRKYSLDENLIDSSLFFNMLENEIKEIKVNQNTPNL